MPFPNEDEGPMRDPLDVAAEQAAIRFISGEPMDAVHWEALHAKAASELRDIDLLRSPQHYDF